MYLYAQPPTLICPSCEQVMLCSTQSKLRFTCANPSCRLYRRWFKIELPLVEAHSVPSDNLEALQ
jgi:hypothetical protein